jgi:hypothetical protein
MPTHYGKWSDPGIPHRGWTSVDVEDLGPSEMAVCEMCEEQRIRSVHTMEHSDHPVVLRVGCICAGNMEQDLVGARNREAEVRQRGRRRSGWLERKGWRISQAGNPYINYRGLNVALYRRGPQWAARIVNRDTDETIWLPACDSVNAAALAAYDAIHAP